jgi:hypothetical protein
MISTATTSTMSMDNNMTHDSTTPAPTSHYYDSQPASTSPVHLGQSHSSSVSMSHEEMQAKILLLTTQLMEKEEEIRVAIHGKEEVEAMLEDIKDVLQSILDH